MNEKPKLNKESLEKHFLNLTETDLQYQPPIKLIMERMTSAIEHDIEKEVYKAVQHYNIVVDREELLKALKYDRHQYELGYHAGLRKASEVAREIFEEISKRFDALLKFYPCNGEFEDAKKFVEIHWKYIKNSIMSDYKEGTTNAGE